MSKFIVCLFALCIVVSLTKAESKSCPKRNQRWNKCGTHCPLKCGEIPARLCNRICVRGCECQTGTILRDDGECVKPKDC